MQVDKFREHLMHRLAPERFPLPSGGRRYREMTLLELAAEVLDPKARRWRRPLTARARFQVAECALGLAGRSTAVLDALSMAAGEVLARAKRRRG